MKEDIIVISLGGSLIASKEGIDVKFLTKFRSLIFRHASRGKRFIIIAGGGATARIYNAALKKIVNPKDEDLDWQGIYATRLNASLLKAMFRTIAYPELIEDPTKKVKFKEKVLVGAGWKPGFSSDMDAVIMARNYGAEKVINISNIKYAYDKDPKKYKDARPLKDVSWKKFRKIVGSKWVPGMNVPFDPIASKIAHKLGLKVMIAGKDVKNLEKIFEGRDFIGTRIS